jgi:hypothetical protein
MYQLFHWLLICYLKNYSACRCFAKYLHVITSSLIAYVYSMSNTLQAGVFVNIGQGLDQICPPCMLLQLHIQGLQALPSRITFLTRVQICKEYANPFVVKDFIIHLKFEKSAPLSLEALNCLSSLYVLYCIHNVFHGRVAKSGHYLPFSTYTAARMSCCNCQNKSHNDSFWIAVDLLNETVWTRNGATGCDAYGISNSIANFVAFQLYCSCFVLDRVEPP